MPRNNPPNCPFPILGLFLAPWLLQGCGGLTASSSGGSPNPAPTPSSIDVVTYHYDNMRSGQNTHETVLTTANTKPVKFGKLGAFIVDGKVDAQPLYLSNVSIPGQGMRNVLYVATEHGSVFAFDADRIDRKSTRLNSSHGYISYAVFCLKKKKTYTAHILGLQPTFPKSADQLSVPKSTALMYRFCR